MKAFIFLCMVSMSQFASAQNFRFAGHFGDITVTGTGCEEVFDDQEYITEHTLMGPTRRTIVSHFGTREGEGFFHGRTFVSNFGYNNDFLYEKTLNDREGKTTFEIYGILDWDAVYMELEVVRYDADENLLCTASSTYAGFYR